jgi:hypothetical protein
MGRIIRFWVMDIADPNSATFINDKLLPQLELIDYVLEQF